ncbi:hypothetical protein K0M31_011382 [Melipona bicolor]|uniref:Uncharacterized protein n=1 Tax=Melipona bicolor TaxID=60889 RepID=A0AA40KUP5_9HYME|nr:hypothetical protein K0M31_011382 [Melipona bicolor]
MRADVAATPRVFLVVAKADERTGMNIDGSMSDVARRLFEHCRGNEPLMFYLMADARRVLGCTDAEAQSRAAADDDDEPTRFRIRLDPPLIHAKASKARLRCTQRFAIMARWNFASTVRTVSLSSH